MSWSEALPTLLLSAVPLLLALGAAFSARQTSPTPAWRLAKVSTSGALLLAIGLLAWALVPGAEAGFWQSAPLNLVMLTLVSFIGFVVVRYSAQYLQGEPRQTRFAALVQAVFAAVSIAVLSDHLLLFLAAWLGISLAMHQLLMFYPERPRAALAAHKKFLFARAAELCALSAFALLYLHHGTGHISTIVAAYAEPASLTLTEHLAASLLAMAALIKCAQLPLHGWLIQVVEAPTPVSATLHGGVINLGGYLLLMFAPLVLQSAPAQALLLVVAGLSSVLAALVMMTRISIKVRLAWSTSAQMGLMLVEIALGLVELALLHLLAHSCYKAYAFLSSGEAVVQDRQRRLAPARTPPIGQWLGAGLCSVLLVAGLLSAGHYGLGLAWPETFSPWVLLALALTTLMAERDSRLSAGSLLRFAALAVVLAAVYFGLKTLFGLFFPDYPRATPLWADLWMSTLFAALSMAYALLRHGAHRPAVQRLAVALYAGFYLDEWVTKTTLKLWPHRLPTRARPKQLHPISEEGLL